MSTHHFFVQPRRFCRLMCLCGLALCAFALASCTQYPARSGGAYGNGYDSGYGGSSTNSAMQQAGQIVGQLMNNNAQTGSSYGGSSANSTMQQAGQIVGQLMNNNARTGSSGYGGFSTNSAMQQAGQMVGQLMNANAQAGSISRFPTGLPQDYQDFKQRYRSLGTSPQGAVKMYFDAVFCIIAGTPTQQAEGEKMLRYALHGGPDWQRMHPTLANRLHDPDMHYIFRSFAAGTSRENGYAMNPNQYQLVFTGVREDPGLTTVFLRSSGADSPRPVQTRFYDDGLWYIFQPASTYSMVQEPLDPRRNVQHDADYDDL